MEGEIPAPSGPDFCWSNLPADLLIRIFSELEILDLLSSGAVCRSWNAQHLTVRRLGLCSVENQGPCLVYASQDGDPNKATLQRFSTSKLYHIPIPNPPFRERYVFGSSHGWLVAADELSNPHLLNPITGVQIDLPPVKTLAPVKSWLDKDRVFLCLAIFDIEPASPEINVRRMPPVFSLEGIRHAIYIKAVLSSDPFGGNCTVLLIHRPRSQLSFARPGDRRWTWIVANKRGLHYDDCFYDEKDGVFYAINCSGQVHSIDLSGPDPVVNIFPQDAEFCEECSKYIMRAPWGDLIEVWRYHHILDGERRTHKVTVYRIDLNRSDNLVEINDLQGHALFVGFGSSFFVTVKNFPLLNPNCIYLSHDKAKSELLGRNSININELLVFNLADCTLGDFLPSPNRCLNYPPPIWIQPSCSLDK